MQIGFIMFNPYSTFNELRENAYFLAEIGELYRFFPLTLAMSAFPGTPIATRLQQDGLMERLDYREPLHCFRYVDPRIAEIVALMHGFYERHHALDARILAAIGYDGRGNADLLRRQLSEINLRHFLEVLEMIELGAAGGAPAAIEAWVAELAGALSDGEVSASGPAATARPGILAATG